MVPKTSRADCADSRHVLCLKRRTFYQCHHRALLVDAAAAAASAADAHTVPCMVSAMKWLWWGATLCTPRSYERRQFKVGCAFQLTTPHPPASNFERNNHRNFRRIANISRRRSKPPHDLQILELRRAGFRDENSELLLICAARSNGMAMRRTQITQC